MAFTDHFVRRPVLSLVVSALILVIGLRAMVGLPILQYPAMQNGVVTVTTTYAGADIITCFITSPLENVIAQANGIDYMTSSSQTGVSTITVNPRLNYNTGDALTEISTKVNSVLSQLPHGDKVSSLGLNMSDVGAAMATMLGGNYANYFGLGGRSYKVIPQVKQQHRLNTDQLFNYYIKASDGTSVPLSTIAWTETKTVPQSLNHFQQLNSATISGIPMPGMSDGEALDELIAISARALPAGYSYGFAGASRQLEQESGGFVTTFALALVIIFLALASLFNSLRDPLVILVSVPMSLAGALVFIWLGIGGATINIYTQVGLVTLMGLVSKHGILMVEVANTLRQQGLAKREAVIEAASIRLRPILMTTAAMVLGVTPLIIATGVGANSRYNMGLVIASGLSIGTLFTLFVVPTFYLLLSHSDEPAPATARAGA